MTYDLRRNRIVQAGSQTYPVNYTFDPQGCMLTMTTTNAEGPNETQWIYNAPRGWLDRKEYDGGNGTDYTYTPTGRLETRVWEHERDLRSRLLDIECRSLSWWNLCRDRFA